MSQSRNLIPLVFLLLSFAIVFGTWYLLDKNSGPPPFPVRFVNVTKRAGIHFRHFNGATGQKLLPETMGSGVAVLDYDGDGLPDLLFINSRSWPGQSTPKDQRHTPALYRN